MNEQEFTAYLDEAFESLEKKQQALHGELSLGSYPDYALDLDNGRMIFSSDRGRLVFETAVIGSWARENKTFLWGWADGSLSASARKDSEKFKALGIITGLDTFLQERVDCEGEMAVELGVLGVKASGAVGLYRVEGEAFDRYLALMKVLDRPD